MIQEGNDKQDDIYFIITELMALAKLKDKESVENGFKKVMVKITEYTNDYETIMKLTGIAVTISGVLKATMF